MEKANTYVYFALMGDDFNSEIATEKISIIPTETWNRGDKGKYNQNLKYSCWKLSTGSRLEYLMVDELVDEIVEKLFDKIEAINELKKQYDLHSVLQIVMYVDCNEEESTPALGHNLKTIEFLYRTQTTTDVDICRFDSSSSKE